MIPKRLKADLWPLLALLWVCSLAVFARLGYDYRDAREGRAQLDQAREMTTQAVESARDAQRRDAQILSATEKNNQAAKTRAAQLQAQLQHQEKTYVQSCAVSTVSAVPDAPTAPAAPTGRYPLGLSVLDQRTLRLLNDARANVTTADPDAASAGDAEELAATAPSAVTGADLALSDLELARMYHDLAQRHDALVDWIMENSKVKP